MSYHRNPRRPPAQPAARPPHPDLPPDRDIMDGLIPDVLQIISKPSIPLNEPEVKIRNEEYIGSFDWVDAQTPTIVVPGSPRRWLNKPTPYQVQQDSGLMVVDKSGYCLPTMPLLPIFVAVDTITRDEGKLEIDWPSIDFVAKRGLLRKLLVWVSASPLDEVKEFRIDTQLAGKKTVICNKWEKRVREECRPWVWGMNFKKANTAPVPGCGETIGHNRIIKYKMNGLNLIVDFDVDTYLPPPGAATTSSQPKSRASATGGIEDLASTLAALSVSDPSSSAPSTSYGDAPRVKVIRGGQVVPQSQLGEIRSMSHKRRDGFDWAEPFHKIWLAKIPYHFMGIHQSGRFIDVEKRTLGAPDFAQVERKAKPHFQKLLRLLESIQKVVVEHGQRGRLTLVCCKDGQLKVFERRSRDKLLTTEILERFD